MINKLYDFVTASVLAFSMLLAIGSNGQFISFKDILLSDGYVLNRAGQNQFVFAYKMKTSTEVLSQFRKIEFDSLLNLTDTTVIYLSGVYSLVSSASLGNTTINLLGSSQGSLMAHCSKSDSKENRIIPLLTTEWSPRWRLHQIRAIPSQDGFLVISQPDNLSINLIFIKRSGDIKWKKTLVLQSKRVGLNNWATTDKNLHLVFTTNLYKPKQSTEWRVFDLENGAELPGINLNKPGQKIAVDNLFATANQIYFVGRTFIVRKLKPKFKGAPIIFKCNDLDQGNIQTIIPPPELPIFWMDAITNSNNETFLIGETFQSGTPGEYMAKGIATGILTMGLVSVTWNTMHFKQVAILPVSQDGAIKPKLLDLEPRKIQLGVYLDPYSFASYSYRTGQVRYMGSNHLGGIYLLDNQQMQYYLAGQESSEVLGIKPEGFVRSIFVSKSYMISINESKLKGRAEISVKNFTPKPQE